MRQVQLIAITILSISLKTSDAWGAACCTSASAFGVGRLLQWETFAVGIGSGFAAETGVTHVDDEGLFIAEHKHGGGTFRNRLWGIAGIAPRTELFFQLPIVSTNVYTLDSSGAWLTGIGDVEFGGRYEFVRIGEFLYTPGIALVSSVLAPTGTPMDMRDDETAISGNGHWGFSLGLTLEQTWMPWFLQLNTGLNVYAPRVEKGQTELTWRGPAIQVAVVGGVEIVESWVLSAVLQYKHEFSDILGSINKPTLSFSSSWRFDPHWTLLTSLGTDIVTYGLARNEEMQAFASAGIRYGYF